MTNKDHEYVNGLLAAYVFHAVDKDETVAIESHLENCDICQSDVDGCNATAGLLGSSAGSAPDIVWDRIMEKIDPAEAPPMDIERARRKRQGQRNSYRTRLTAVAAVLVIVAAGVGVAVGNSHRNTPSELDLAKAAANAPGSKQITLTGASNQAKVDVVLSANGTGYVESSTLPALPAGRAYQLWLFMGTQTPISAGMLGQSIQSIAFASRGHISELAITDEQVSGSQTPTSAPLVTGTVTV